MVRLQVLSFSGLWCFRGLTLGGVFASCTDRLKATPSARLVFSYMLAGFSLTTTNLIRRKARVSLPFGYDLGLITMYVGGFWDGISDAALPCFGLLLRFFERLRWFFKADWLGFEWILLVSELRIGWLCLGVVESYIIVL